MKRIHEQITFYVEITGEIVNTDNNQNGSDTEQTAENKRGSSSLLSPYASLPAIILAAATALGTNDLAGSRKRKYNQG